MSLQERIAEAQRRRLGLPTPRPAPPDISAGDRPGSERDLAGRTPVPDTRPAWLRRAAEGKGTVRVDYGRKAA